jgi:hypothetical protein
VGLGVGIGEVVIGDPLGDVAVHVEQAEEEIREGKESASTK